MLLDFFGVQPLQGRKLKNVIRARVAAYLHGDVAMLLPLMTRRAEQRGTTIVSSHETPRRRLRSRGKRSSLFSPSL